MKPPRPMFIPAENFPTHDMLLTMLMAERYHLVGGTLHFWLCVDETRCEIVRDRRDVFGIYKRGPLGKGDSNNSLQFLAHELIEGLAEAYERVVQLRQRTHRDREHRSDSARLGRSHRQDPRRHGPSL